MIDHRPAQTLVRNQGDRPTCAGFAVSAAHEWVAADGELRSPEHAIWAGHQVRSVPGREETTIAWSLKGLSHHQHATETAWPYGQPPWTAGPPANALKQANTRALPPSNRLAPPWFDAIREALVIGDPVILTIGVIQPLWQTPTLMIDAGPGRKTQGNHAVVAVGISEEGEEPERVLVKNSWGPGWADGGYGAISRRYLDHYTIAAHRLERP
jgi:Papain family cysteine protease